MSQTDKWFPLWVGDFLSDTAHLSDAETGQYMLLLMCMWRHGAQLPDEPKMLSRVARCRRVSPVVMAFFQRSNGTITQKRLTIEHEKQMAYCQSQRTNARARWDANTLKNNKAGDATAYAKSMPSNSNSNSKITKSEKITSTEIAVDEFRSVFWSMYPHKTGKPAALRAWHAARKRAALNDIMGGLKVYIETKPADRPWLNPATFLNQDRWADEPAPVATRRSKTMEVTEQLLREACDAESDAERSSNGSGSARGIVSVPAPRAEDFHPADGGSFFGKADGTD